MPNYFDRYDEAPAAAPPTPSNYFDRYDQPSGGGFDATRSALDVAKQIPAGLVAGTESIATFPAQAAGFIGGLVEKIPGMAPSTEQAQRRQDLLKLIEENRKGGIASLLPRAETGAGEVARDVSQF